MFIVESTAPDDVTSRPLRFANAHAWHAWLEANHREATEAVLYLTKKAVPRGLHYLEALDEALCYGWIDGKLRAHDASGFLQRFTPRRADSVWSLSNRERVNRLSREGRMTAAGRAAIEAGRRSGAWQAAYRAAAPPPLPRDLRAALRENPEAWTHFRAWGASYRSACIYWVTTAKRETTREDRIRRIVKRAAENRRPGIEGF